MSNNCMNKSTFHKPVSSHLHVKRRNEKLLRAKKKSIRNHCHSIHLKKGIFNFAGFFRYNSNERILRYPNGEIRYIRYPIIELSSKNNESNKEEQKHDNINSSKTRYRKRGFFYLNNETTEVSNNEIREKKEFPNTPLELLRYVQSDEYKKANLEKVKKIKNSYKICNGCPWVEPRQCYVLALISPLQQPKDMIDSNREEHPMTYTLKTKVKKSEIANELFKLFRKREEKRDFIEVNEVIDGIITFLNEEDALRFKESLQAENENKVIICEIESHYLFREANASKSVVVVVDGKTYLPTPLELTVSLKGSQSFEDLKF